MRAEPLEPRRIRRPQGAYGWTDLRVVTQGHIEEIGPEAALTYLFLCTVGNSHGVSFWGRDRMAATLGLTIPAIGRCIDKLVAYELIATQGRIVQVLPLEMRDLKLTRSVPAPVSSSTPNVLAIEPVDVPVDEELSRSFEPEARIRLAQLGSRAPQASSVRALARSLARKDRRSSHG